MNANEADVSVGALCGVLLVSAIGYYARREPALPGRAIDNAVLPCCRAAERIRTVRAASDPTFGMPRVRAVMT